MSVIIRHRFWLLKANLKTRCANKTNVYIHNRPFDGRISLPVASKLNNRNKTKCPFYPVRREQKLLLVSFFHSFTEQRRLFRRLGKMKSIFGGKIRCFRFPFPKTVPRKKHIHYNTYRIKLSLFFFPTRYTYTFCSVAIGCMYIERDTRR